MNTFSCMKRNVQPDSVNKKITIVSLGDYSRTKKVIGTHLCMGKSAVKFWQFAMNKIKTNRWFSTHNPLTILSFSHVSFRLYALSF